MSRPSAGPRALPQSLSQAPNGEQRLPQDVMEHHQRQRVIETVAELVHAKGIEPNGGEITDAAKMSRTTFYKLFGSKRGCIDSACLAATELLVEPVRAAERLPEAWLGCLDAGLGGLLERAEAEPLMAELCLVHSPRLLGAPLAAGPAAVRSALVALLGGGREAGRASCGAGYNEPAAGAEVFVAAGIIAMLEHCLRDGGVEASAERRAELVKLATEQFVSV